MVIALYATHDAPHRGLCCTDSEESPEIFLVVRERRKSAIKGIATSGNPLIDLFYLLQHPFVEVIHIDHR